MTVGHNAGDQRLATAGLATALDSIASPLDRLVRPRLAWALRRKLNLVNATARINHARSMPDDDAFLLATTNRVAVGDDRAILDEVVRDIGHELE